MQGNDKVIEHLNKILSNELRAINQYFLHSRMLSDWGLDKFAQYEYGESMDEMKHADVLIQRILFLEGLPNMTYLGNVYIAEEPIEILHNDLKLENEAIPDLREAILACEAVNDFVSRDLLQKILESEEEHVDHLETQLDLLEKVGHENFLQNSNYCELKTDSNSFVSCNSETISQPPTSSPLTNNCGKVGQSDILGRFDLTSGNSRTSI